jgi:hypothetical protein
MRANFYMSVHHPVACAIEVTINTVYATLFIGRFLFLLLNINIDKKNMVQLRIIHEKYYVHCIYSNLNEC